MGANAQTTVPTFTAGEVLTAAQQNASARTGVPVFATTGTRDAGFGGTGEKTLAEGQLCYVEGTGLQSYNGTSWVTWGTAPSAGSLTLVSTTTIGNAVSSVTVTSAFSSTYDNYLITITGGAGTDASQSIGVQLGSTTTGYYMARSRLAFSSASQALNNVSNGSSWSDSVFRADSAGKINGSMDIFAPNLAQRTYFCAQCVAEGGDGWVSTGGYQASSTQFTSFVLTPASGTLTGGTIRVYGYANS